MAASEAKGEPVTNNSERAPAEARRSRSHERSDWQRGRLCALRAALRVAGGSVQKTKAETLVRWSRFPELLAILRASS